jgi:DNA-binding CsgD family transcriptional regulator
VDKAALLFVHAYATGMVLLHFKDITDPILRSILKAYFGIFILWLVSMGAQTAVFAGLSESSIWRGAPIAQLVYQISMSTLILYFAGRYVYRPEPVPGSLLARDFVERFGISNRESEIIALIIQGYKNNKIGEKLFISTRTVKNHVYNIYQKTKVENKVQLMNLIRSNGLM